MFRPDVTRVRRRARSVATLRYARAGKRHQAARACACLPSFLPPYFLPLTMFRRQTFSRPSPSVKSPSTSVRESNFTSLHFTSAEFSLLPPLPLAPSFFLSLSYLFLVLNGLAYHDDPLARDKLDFAQATRLKYTHFDRLKLSFLALRSVRTLPQH